MKSKLLKGKDVRIAILREGFVAWQEIPSQGSGVNVKPILDGFKNKYKQDITEMIIEQSMKGLEEEGLVKILPMNEDNIVVFITDEGRSYYIAYQEQVRNKYLAILGAVLGSLGFVLSLTKIIWDIVK